MFVALVIALFALPIVLMAAAHYYGVVAQDRRFSFTLMTAEGVSPRLLADEHANRFHVEVHRVYEHGFLGYTGTVHAKYWPLLQSDERVLRLDRQESDEFP